MCLGLAELIHGADRTSATLAYDAVLFRLGWRWAFIIQIPLFVISFVLTSINLHYVTPVRTHVLAATTNNLSVAGSIIDTNTLAPFLRGFSLWAGQKQKHERRPEEDRLWREHHALRRCQYLPFFVVCPRCFYFDIQGVVAAPRNVNGAS